MRITIQVTCDSPDDAMEAMSRLTKPINKLAREFIGSTESDLDRYLGKPVKIEISGSEIGAKDSGKKVDNDAETSGLASHPTTRPNVSPGEPSIGKIGTSTKDQIMEFLSKGQQMGPKYAEHMKLLWKRGEIKFDGQEYYL